MTMGLPIVSALNRFRSSDNRHGSSPAAPMTLFVDAATMMLIIGSCQTATAALMCGCDS